MDFWNVLFVISGYMIGSGIGMVIGTFVIVPICEWLEKKIGFGWTTAIVLTTFIGGWILLTFILSRH